MPDVPELPPSAAPEGWAPPVAAPMPRPADPFGAGAAPPPLDPEPDPASGPWWRRRVAALPVAAWIALGVVAGVAIVVAGLALSADDDEPRLAIDVPAVTTDARGTPAATPAPTAPVASSVPSPTAAAPTTVPASAPDEPADTRPSTGPGNDPKAPLPAGDPASRFQYDDGLGSAWSGTVTGVVETPSWDDTSGERCFVVIGTIVPEAAPGFVSDAWTAPYVTLFVEDQPAESGSGACQTGTFDAAGYQSLYTASATVGTELAFYSEFSLPEAVGAPQAVAVTASGTDDWRFFEAALLPELPPVTVGPVGPLPIDPAAVGAGAPGTFRHRDEYSADAWSGSIVGLVEIPRDETYDELDGRCFAVVATLTADEVGSGITTTPYGAPPVHLVADGRLLSEYYGCAADGAEAAGYAWASDTEITAGTSLAVYSTVLVRAPFPGELQAVVVGDPWGDDVSLFAPFVLDAFPPAANQPGPPPPGPLAPAGAPATVVDEYAEATWNLVVHGYVVTGDCVVVYVRATLTEGEPGETVPFVALVAGGHVASEDYACETAAATDAGYVELWKPEVQVGVPVDVFVAFRVAPAFGDPQAIVVGGVGIGEPLAVTPVALPAPPAIPR